MVLALVLAACGGGGGGAKSTATSTRIATSAPIATETPGPTATPLVRIPSAPATNITLPVGFTAYRIADGFTRPTSIALAPDGAVYISAGDTVYRLLDADSDGVFEDGLRVASGFPQIDGIMIAPDGLLYVSSKGRVTTVRDTDGDFVGDEQTDIITGLPNGSHQNNGLVLGPDGMLYVTNGSTCDECVEEDERAATILQANADGSLPRVYAGGLRNSYDLVFDDQGRLWATDNGSDGACATIDELNLIVAGGDYGWPYAADGCDPYNDGIPPAADLRLHSASTGIDFYDGAQFPAAYRGDLFITLWGGYLPPAASPALLRAVLSDSSATVEDFGTGFERPIDVVVDRDGSLLVLDFGSSEGAGSLYRIVYSGS